MAKNFDILNVKSAVKSHSKMDLSFDHLTTMSFGQIQPLLVEELLPGDSFTVQGNYFSRLAPLVKPTYGKFAFKTVQGFVPYYQLADDAEAFLAGKSVYEGSTPTLRYLTGKTLCDFIIINCIQNLSGDAATQDNSDIVYINASGTTKYARFTTIGKYYVKVLNALGYAIPSNIDMQTESNWMLTIGAQKFNAMPLLAFAKLYNDWMSQSQKYNTSALTELLKNIRHNVGVSSVYSNNTRVISGTGILTLLSNVKLCYENDYFISAWADPNKPIHSVEANPTIQVPGNNVSLLPDVIQSDYSNNYINSNQDLQEGRLTQRSLDFLQSFDNWVRRNNYSGSRAVQNVYSRFGIKTEDYRSNYAHLIGTSSMTIQVGDITSQAGSDVSDGLGSYAGKGILADKDGFSFKSSDYGVLLVLGYVAVYPMMPYGNDRSVLRTTVFDFYNPEFDGLGADAISYGEVFANPISVPGGDPWNDDAVYGYTERYNAYRFGRDKITGDFRNYHTSNVDANTWHTGRLLNSVRAQGYLSAQSGTMVNYSPDTSEFNRFFSISDPENKEDKFYFTIHFNVDAVRPMMNLNEVPRLGVGDTQVPRNGNVIS